MIKWNRIKADAKKDPSLWSWYKQLLDKLTAKIRLSIQEYYPGLIEQHKKNPTEMWKTVNKVLNRGTGETAISSLNVDETK